jgi:uncharacterized protein (TIGR02996 family)
MSAADRAAFLRAIADHPEDDLPRLVYADWLDEHGQPERAEFIRVQCERAARIAAGDGRLTELSVREQELLAVYGHAWATEWDGLRGVAWEGFGRGFVDTYYVSDVAEFVMSSDPALRAVPIGRLFLRSARTSDLRTLVESPVMAHLPDLSVGGCKFGNAGAEVLAATPGARRLRRLSLTRNQIGDRGAQALAESPHLADLRCLDLVGNRIGDTGAEALAAAPGWDHLEHLDVALNRIGREGKAVLRARYARAVNL